MCLLFVGSVKIFGRSDDDIIILHCKLSIVAIFKKKVSDKSDQILVIYKILSFKKDDGLFIFILA
jgi:hypothetical protein